MEDLEELNEKVDRILKVVEAIQESTVNDRHQV